GAVLRGLQRAGGIAAVARLARGSGRMEGPGPWLLQHVAVVGRVPGRRAGRPDGQPWPRSRRLLGGGGDDRSVAGHGTWNASARLNRPPPRATFRALRTRRKTLASARPCTIIANNPSSNIQVHTWPPSTTSFSSAASVATLESATPRRARRSA